jgi:hypothetical protein
MIWFQEPSALLEDPMAFWPTQKQNFADKVNSVTRFIIYSSAVAYFFKRDPKVILLGILVLLAMFLYFKVNPNPAITVDPQDPMNNFTDDRVYNPQNVSNFMSRAFPDDKRNAERPFFTMPTWDLEPFLALQNRGMEYCRDNQSACTAEGNPHYPDEPTIRAQYGLTSQLTRF